MDAVSPPPDDAAAAALMLDKMRALFLNADRMTRRKLVPILPPAVVEFSGVSMYVDPRDNFTDRMIWRDGQPPEIRSLTALVEMVEGRNAFILDIGANSGAFTIPLGVACAAESRIIAFEPNPTMIGRLGHNIRLNALGEKVRIEGCALGDEMGEAVLNFRLQNFGQASLMPIKKPARDGGALVPVRPLLDYVHEATGHDLSVLKIDVEGAEVAVMKPLLDAGGWMPDAMLIETAHADQWDDDLVGRILDMGFEVTLAAEQNTLFVRKDA